MERNISRIDVNKKSIKESFLIVCEGINTECEYFDGFRLTSAKVKTVGQGKNTISLVNEAISIKESERKKGNKYDQYWVVFDKDSFPANDFNNAISIAVAKGFQVAYSNQSFELWFLLHFNIYEGCLHRNQYEKLLNNHLNYKYSKEAGFCTKIFNTLFPLTDQAVQNAKNVYNNVGDHSSPANEESSTTVFLLVEELIKFI